ncbi:unnamed protein product [Diplocarpon coronariae]|nr:hypothetical protein JHW43_007043 [Diplocarpon mali]
MEAFFKQVGKLDHIIFTAGDKLASIPIQSVAYKAIMRAGRIRFFAPLLIANVDLYGMTRNLAIDQKPMRVNLVSPAAVVTELWKDMAGEVAEAYLWLTEDSNVTGNIAACDSGASLV